MHPLPRMPPGAAGPEEYSEHERRNMAAAREYMELSYDPKRASADAVRHLVAEGASFEAHSTFPAVHDPLAYAQHHADDIMTAVPDLRIESFDNLFAKENRVCVRYTATGSHCGAPRRGIPPSGASARWTACIVFHFNESSKITHMSKDWDKLAMWHALGWAQLSPLDLH